MIFLSGGKDSFSRADFLSCGRKRFKSIPLLIVVIGKFFKSRLAFARSDSQLLGATMFKFLILG